MKSKIGIFLYARLNSKRLPKKVLLKIGKKNILEIIIHRLKKLRVLKKKFPITILTSNNKSDDVLVKFCKKKKLKYFCGSEKNVLKRTVDCIKKLNIKYFIRINCDRPFIDYDKLIEMIKYFKKNNHDILTNNLKFCPSGLVIEISKSSIFLDSFHNVKKRNEKEHIFNYFYNNKNNYFIKDLPYVKSSKLNKIKLSLDTKKDLNRLKKIYEHFNYDYDINTKKVLDYLLNKK